MLKPSNAPRRTLLCLSHLWLSTAVKLTLLNLCWTHADSIRTIEKSWFVRMSPQMALTNVWIYSCFTKRKMAKPTTASIRLSSPTARLSLRRVPRWRSPEVTNSSSVSSDMPAESSRRHWQVFLTIAQQPCSRLMTSGFCGRIRTRLIRWRRWSARPRPRKRRTTSFRILSGVFWLLSPLLQSLPIASWTEIDNSNFEFQNLSYFHPAATAISTLPSKQTIFIRFLTFSSRFSYLLFF